MKEKLEDLSQRRAGLESGLEELESTIASVKGKAVNQEVVLAALNRFKDISREAPALSAEGVDRAGPHEGRGDRVPASPLVPRKACGAGGLRENQRARSEGLPTR